MMNFRTLALAAALIGSLAAPAFADQDRVPEGATASRRWTAAESRTPLASPAANPQQNFLALSGATGGFGQHS
ncbi:hypothetical protein [Roseomonas indoligenes]|uniref:Uncharacterized protein n=1 Tax=Roseomonas indoligenes TaxID=2820811 RepID=A0A940MUF0_9PROT|nr:hypothetical protein [Pararoseomonas indoligenes]MBP0494328.1 hypothetical protein [Pararoseomonas indoligenes]